jgi:hypothetical protein
MQFYGKKNSRASRVGKEMQPEVMRDLPEAYF